MQYNKTDSKSLHVINQNAISSDRSINNHSLQAVLKTPTSAGLHDHLVDKSKMASEQIAFVTGFVDSKYNIFFNLRTKLKKVAEIAYRAAHKT